MRAAEAGVEGGRARKPGRRKGRTRGARPVAGPPRERITLDFIKVPAVASDDKAAARAPEPEVEPPPEAGGKQASTPVPVARVEVRVTYAPAGAVSEIPAIPLGPSSLEEVSGERPALPPEEVAFLDEPTAPRRAADVLPPRNRRELRDEHPTPVRGSPIPRAGDDVDTQASGDRPPNKRPSKMPPADLARPLFEQDWGAAPQGNPTWRPGAPPVDIQPSRENYYVVAFIAALGVGAIILWLSWWAA